MISTRVTSEARVLPHVSRALLVAGVALAVLGTGPVTAQTQSTDKCPTWFPDFRCDRQGRYEGFVQPVSMPYLFEDPFITSGLQLGFLWHQLPDDSVFEGGDVMVLALQARLAITDRLAFIATKDGITWVRPRLSLLEDQDGLMNITVGFKYALIDRPEDNFILTPSLRYEIPLGNQEVFQGKGDGVIIPGVSTAWGHDEFHVIADFGAQLPIDGDLNSTSLFYNVHLDYALWKHFVPLVELSGLYYLDDGNGSFPVDTKIGAIPVGAATAALGKQPFEGADAVNLGNVGVDGNSFITMAVGFRIPFKERWSLGTAYEVPITGQKDIWQQRVTTLLSYDF